MFTQQTFDKCTVKSLFILTIENISKILWHFDHNQPMQIFDLNTVTYGVATSAFLVIRCLHQLASDEKDRFPRAIKVVAEKMYVDDALFGSDNIPQVIALVKEFSDLLMAGGFLLRN